MKILPVVSVLLGWILLQPLTAIAQINPAAGPDSEETLREQALALEAERSPDLSPVDLHTAAPQNVEYPLLIGVDDAITPAYRIRLADADARVAYFGFTVWGAAYDPKNDWVYFTSGSTLRRWPAGGGGVITLGTITNTSGATQSISGLAFYDGHLYGVKIIGEEAIYRIDPYTLVASIYIDYANNEFDFSGLAVDPNTGYFYGTNDQSNPHGAGLFRINQDGSGTLITPYPAGETDVDGLAISHEGLAYLVTDDPGFIYVYDLIGGAYTVPLPSPYTESGVHAGAAWIWDPPPVVYLPLIVAP